MEETLLTRIFNREPQNQADLFVKSAAMYFSMGMFVEADQALTSAETLYDQERKQAA